MNSLEFGARLGYVTITGAPPPETEDTYWFSIDTQLIYLSFYKDSGPLNAACLYRFCLHVHTLLEDPKLKAKKIVLYSSSEYDKKANAVLLLALYAMIVMRWSPGDVLHPLSALELQPFRDAGYARADYHLSHQSLLYGISKAIQCHLLDLSTFDLNYYETYEKVENGDWNWITPGFLAFASPVEPAWIAGKGGVAGAVGGAKPRLSQSFRNVLDEFEKGNIKVVVRLNKQLYDATHFTDRGMEHVEMYFDDGTNPTLEMTREFIDLADRVIEGGGALAVHCKAGLGRTGTLIGAYLIYKHGFTASEAIGFMRLMRPGSCVGPQQHYLYEHQMVWVQWSAVDAYKKTHPLILATPCLATSTSTDLLERVEEGAVGGKRERSATHAEEGEREGRERPPHPITPPQESTRSRNSTPSPSHPSPSHALPPLAPSTPPPNSPLKNLEILKTPERKLKVPGQPRKTPGKSKHGIAAPERASLGGADLEGMELELGEVELAGAVDSKGKGKAMDVDESADEIMDLPLAGPAVVVSSRPRPTRIARSAAVAPVASTSTSNAPATSKFRSKSAITDTRYADVLTALPSGNIPGSPTKQKRQLGVSTANVVGGEEIKRSKTSRNLGGLMEGFSAAPASRKNEDTEGSAGRYHLRGASSSGIPVAGASPSKLPLRTTARKRATPALPPVPLASPPSTTAILTRSSSASSSSSFLAQGISEREASALAGRNGAILGNRSVRRRRSSLGSEEFVQPVLGTGIAGTGGRRK